MSCTSVSTAFAFGYFFWFLWLYRYAPVIHKISDDFVFGDSFCGKNASVAHVIASIRPPLVLGKVREKVSECTTDLLFRKHHSSKINSD